MEVNNHEVGARIKDIRLNLGLTAEEFGKIIDSDSPASQSLVSRWERGVNLPNRDRLKAIADLAEISVSQLMYGDHKNYIASIVNNAKEFKDENIGLSVFLFYDEFYNNTDFYPPKQYVVDEFQRYLKESREKNEKSRYDKEKIKKILEQVLLKKMNTEAFDALIDALHDVTSVDFGFLNIYDMYFNNDSYLDGNSDILINDKQSLVEYLKQRRNILDSALENKENINQPIEIDLTLEIADLTRYINKIEKEFD